MVPLSKEEKRIKSYLIKLLQDEYGHDKKNARRLVEESPFFKIYREDPEYTNHLGIEYWADYIHERNKSNQFVMI
jgi:hypothetical protein